jgi:hypothetical protein
MKYNTKNDHTMVWAYVERRVSTAVKTLSDGMGISVSEYVRRLILADLDSRSFFTTRFKEKMLVAEKA